ncbi:hypothetical protein B0H19DRAFT_1378746 [Mycena capillaripes]|nr:hypothetical protein B0H19DRAFT_1378746 [Mycena capillaripes]
MNHTLPLHCINETGIPANADIAGIGVRAAIYIQNLLGFIPALTALRDGAVASYELESVETQSTTILITAFAILISAMSQARDSTLLLSNFYASIILSLSWLNNTNTFIFFLLYIQRKSQAGPQQITGDLSSWSRLVKSWFSASITLDDNSADAVQAEKSSRQSSERTNTAESVESHARSLLSVIFRVRVQGIVAILGSLHLSMMSALGIWLWHDPLHFGYAALANPCAFYNATYSILGQSIHFRSNALRIVSIVF